MVALILLCSSPVAQGRAFSAPLRFSRSQEQPATATSGPAAQSPSRQSPAPAPPQAPASNSNSAESSSKRQGSHAHDFLIRGTVFQPNALAFPAVQLRIRRASEKKFRWETYTNSRGEFAVRVPQGLQYEVVIHMKGFADQTRNVDARSGISEDHVVFRMESAAAAKNRGKK
jgi:Carboxypeptidase regulatory-like domain